MIRFMRKINLWISNVRKANYTSLKSLLVEVYVIIAKMPKWRLREKTDVGDVICPRKTAMSETNQDPWSFSSKRQEGGLDPAKCLPWKAEPPVPAVASSPCCAIALLLEFSASQQSV